MNYIKSIDGTQIAYEKIGQGTGLIIVGGSLADHHMYHPLAVELSKNYTVYNYDRRNRGMSGASERHSFETELEDLETLMAISTDRKVLYGHSAGAALAIRAAAKGMNIEKLILADLPFSVLDDKRAVEAEKFDKEHQEIKRLIINGNKEGAVRFFLKDFGMSEQELDGFIASEGGQAAIEIGPTLPVDYDILGDGLTPSELLRKIEVPALILTSDYGLAAAQDAAKYLSNSSIHILENPVYMTSPQDIAKPMMDFINTEV